MAQMPKIWLKSFRRGECYIFSPWRIRQRRTWLKLNRWPIVAGGTTLESKSRKTLAYSFWPLVLHQDLQNDVPRTLWQPFWLRSNTPASGAQMVRDCYFLQTCWHLLTLFLISKELTSWLALYFSKFRAEYSFWTSGVWACWTWELEIFSAGSVLTF